MQCTCIGIAAVRSATKVISGVCRIIYTVIIFISFFWGKISEWIGNFFQSLVFVVLYIMELS